MGEEPSWYRILKAAQYLGVPPWDLLDKPAVWIDIALVSLNAENHAREMQERKS